MKATSIIWRRTFPDSAPGTDIVAIFDGRVIGRVRLTELPHDGAKWVWSVRNADAPGAKETGRRATGATRNASAKARRSHCQAPPGTTIARERIDTECTRGSVVRPKYTRRCERRKVDTPAGTAAPASYARGGTCSRV